MNAKRSPSVVEGLTALDINWDVVAVLVLFFVSFAQYAATAAPGVLDGDSGEFQTNIYLLGVSHTGYPLYFLLAKLWTLLMPVGNIAYRANVFSSLFGALTLVLIYGFMRTLTRLRLVALLTAILFGVSRVQWAQAVIPDVYTLNSFFFVLVLWLAILWRIERVPLWTVALAYGLSLTHHRTMILIAPALAIFVLWTGKRAIFKPRILLTTFAALFLPLLLYVYIPLRGPSDIGVEYHPGNSVNILALNAFYDLRFGPPGFLWDRFTHTYLGLLIEQFTLPGFVLGLFGVAALAFKRIPHGFPPGLGARELLLLVGLAHIGETVFAICFWVFDSEIFFIPSYLSFLFFIGIGAAILCDQILSRPAIRAWRRAGYALAALALLGVCIYLVRTNLTRVDQSGNDSADTRWREILALPLEQNATLVGPWQDLTPLEYYQNVENVRPDLQRRKVVLNRDQLKLAPQDKIESELARAGKNGSQLYFTVHPSDTETLTDLGNHWELAPIGTLWRAAKQGQVLSWDYPFAKDDPLQAWGASNFPLRSGDFLNVMLSWSAAAPLDNLRLVWNLRDQSGTLWEHQESYPLGTRAPKPGETLIHDPQGIFIPPDAPPGKYTLTLSALERSSDQPVTIANEGNTLTARLDVTAPDTATSRARLAIPRTLTADVGSRKFLGYEVSSTEPRGGDLLEFSEWWQNINRPDDTFEIKFRDANETETVLYKGVLIPTMSDQLNPGQIVRARQSITIPPTSPAGSSEFLLSLNGEPLPPIRIALGESTRKFRVPIIQRPQLTLVGDSVQLIGYKLDRELYRPGENLPLTLYWETNQTPRASYKVFVHFIDGNGVLRTQQDSIPRRGELPTNRWFPGEYITDEYTLALPNDLAPGEYRMAVGMYDEATGVRVPLTDANGARIADDAVILGERIQVQ